jgi:antibiotic biosynthesis monooxygenase (ABM) superfamily enzyme
MEVIQCSETSAYNIQTPGGYSEDNIVHPQQGESLKTTIFHFYGEETTNIFHHSHLTNYEDGTDTVFRNVGL